MPTILREGPYRFYFYSHEPNEPAHIHVDREKATAKFWIKPVRVARNQGFGTRELQELQRIVKERQFELLKAWHGYFGPRGK